MALRTISWLFYIVGTVLVVGGWIGIVDNTVSWWGWLVAMAGWGMQFLPAFRSATVADELKKLAELHRSGAITDDEFNIAKAELLRR